MHPLQPHPQPQPHPSLDLRSRSEPLQLRLSPELGCPTALLVGGGGAWALAGTHRGFLALWDLRFGLLAAAWRHPSGTPIHGLAHAPRVLLSVVPGAASGAPLVMVAAGDNEVRR